MSKVTPSEGFCWYLKWLSTGFYIAAAICAASGLLPWNYICTLIGACGWTMVGIAWHDRSLIVLNAFTAAMMTMAAINFYGT